LQHVGGEVRCDLGQTATDLDRARTLLGHRVKPAAQTRGR
jgi:hypothetical protein